MMKTITKVTAFSLAAALVALAAPAADAASLDEVVAKHIEAKGGAEAWGKVESIRMTGDFTAFSEVSPFTLHRARDRRYRLDHEQNGRRLIIGYDGEMMWWDNEFAAGGPQRITNPIDIEALEREIDFVTPLFDYEERGFEARLIEERDEIEGFPAIAVEIKRGEESVETWFLDPDTHLELARESPGSDFGQPRPSLTFFDEFREVGGVMIPHYVETQWYTRDRVMDVAEVEINPDLDEAVFGMPVATGMEMFQHMLGEWDVKVESKQSPQQPEFTETAREATITASLNGGLVEESYQNENGIAARRSYSYDRFREHYVMTQMNEVQSFLDVQTGEMADGTLTVSNVETDTSYGVFGMTIHERSTLSNVTADGFSLQRESSIDGGQNWGVIQKLTYTRKGG